MTIGLLAIFLTSILSWQEITEIRASIKQFEISSQRQTQLQRINLLTSEYMRSMHKERVKMQWDEVYQNLLTQLKVLYARNPSQLEILLEFHQKLKTQFQRLIEKSLLCEQRIQSQPFVSGEEYNESQFIQENRYCLELMNRMTNQTLIVAQELSEHAKKFEIQEFQVFENHLLIRAVGILTIVLLVYCLIIIFAAILFRQLSRHIQSLQQGARAIARGDYQHNIKSEGNNELSDVAAAFNYMVKEVNQHHGKLENLVENRTTELSQQKDNLQLTLNELKNTQKLLVESEKNAALGRLVTGVAHEINTPLGINLTGLTHIQAVTKKIKNAYHNKSMTESVFAEYIDDVQNLVDTMHISTKHAVELVRSFKQISVDQHIDDQRRINLFNYINDILAGLKNKIKHRSVIVKNNVETDLELTTFPGSIFQIFTNLINNSLIHGFERNQSGTIKISSERHQKNLILHYRDTGKGVNLKHLNRLFEPFFTTSRGTGGSGLGLSIVYNLVTHKLGGRITCQSNPGDGVHFIISLPLLE